jgi:protein-S-isoprenylcysteine O-methyltransferase Ste14
VLPIVAWLGGALFVVSLGWCLYFYAVILGTPADATSDSLTSAVLFNIALFSTFALHHSLLARSGIKRELTRLVPAAYERTAYVWIASLLLMMVCWWWRPLPGMAYEVPPPWRWGLYAVQAVGVILTWRGAAVVDVLELAGIRQARGEVRPLEFKIVGPFRVVRHPIYLGWILMVFGAPTMTLGRLLFASVSSVYLILAIPWEERSLIEAFGARYQAYQASVRWRILPGIW